MPYPLVCIWYFKELVVPNFPGSHSYLFLEASFLDLMDQLLSLFTADTLLSLNMYWICPYISLSLMFSIAFNFAHLLKLNVIVMSFVKLFPISLCSWLFSIFCYNISLNIYDCEDIISLFIFPVHLVSPGYRLELTNYQTLKILHIIGTYSVFLERKNKWVNERISEWKNVFKGFWCWEKKWELEREVFYFSLVFLVLNLPLVEVFSESPIIISTVHHASAVGYTGLFQLLFLSDYLNDSKDAGMAFLGRFYCAFYYIFPGDYNSYWEGNCKKAELE